MDTRFGNVDILTNIGACFTGFNLIPAARSSEWNNSSCIITKVCSVFNFTPIAEVHVHRFCAGNVLGNQLSSFIMEEICQQFPQNPCYCSNLLCAYARMKHCMLT
ncbi:hypothetical protein NP493_99g05055 [Ridgeia piscesae]|uniref:Uncharacterized protein n=1 Tax=Ridgeia piscesae TaxID=27915 RepID=A0AAD9P802_RIDPI|nr:hypothetical protein NP493_99g05055 [Ridgeia piscesae]